MTIGQYRLLRPREAAALRDDWVTARRETLGVLEGGSVLVVELDGRPTAERDRAPLGPVGRYAIADDDAVAAMPLVLIGISRSLSMDANPPLLSMMDVALTETPGAPAPWVTVSDISSSVGELAERISRTPLAATTLCQVLRLSERGSFTSKLLRESFAYSMLQAGPEFARWRSTRRRRPRSGASADPLLLSRSGQVLALTLNRPAVHNAYNVALRDALCSALELAAQDEDISRVELRGNGPSFCSGGDLDEFGSLLDPATAHLARIVRNAGRLIHGLSDRTVAHLHGHCLGAGIELPAFAGRVVADRSTRFGLPELKLGLIPGAGGTISLPSRIGRQRTAWLALTGTAIDSQQAACWGLIDEVDG